ncbi:hypothetical protein Q1I83_23285 (plasmid) [Salmonella enterica subsp. enterica serovar Abortusovis]|nr:hypothetical protein [Salmonella enterica]WQG06100.1 hypothetical protein Q1J21_23770 [Salmonella enterica subsp. enterica serovar Abortusovis]WQG10646.1 hypothetical protein Q1J09_24015 [Salmonella enterica subsp. enterica serovar Abortusovis]WQG15067.1 hypothetical protein Q1I83_23285 [Salmonella enterica subsp. enterica serovar Abortusovis]
MKSERGRVARLAHTWPSQNPVFLDTETMLADAPLWPDIAQLQQHS